MEIITVHHQEIKRRKASASEKLRRPPVQGHTETVVNQVQPGRNRDPKRGRIFRIIQVILIRESADLEIIARDRHAVRIHRKSRRDPLLKSRKLASSSRKEQCRRSAAVHLQNLLSDLLAQKLCRTLDTLEHLFLGSLPLESQDIGECNHFLLLDLRLHLFRRSEIHQILPHDRLCHLITGNRSHGITGHAAAGTRRDIRRPGSDIHHDKIQKPQILRNRRIDRCDRLQCDADHLKTDLIHRGIETLHNLAGEKCGDQIHLHILSPVILKA